MTEILSNILTVVLIIVLGYIVKSLGLFSREKDFKTVSNIILYLTLPSVIITNLNGLRFPPILLTITLFGVLCNGMYLLLAGLFGKNKEEKSFMMLNINGYNIGNFALPFVAFFLGEMSVLVIVLFDAGNALMVLGGNYAMAKSAKRGESNINISDLFRTAIKSPTIIVQILMIFLSLAAVNLPNFVIEVTEIVGSANTFLAMFLIGLVLDINIDIENGKRIIKYLSLRYLPALLLAVFIFFLPFINHEITYALTLLVIAPIAGSTPIFTDLLGNDVTLSAQVNSMSILLSILLMSSYLVFMGI